MTMYERPRNRRKATWWVAWKMAMREQLEYRGYTFVDHGPRFETDCPHKIATNIAEGIPTGDNWKAYVESLNLEFPE